MRLCADLIRRFPSNNMRFPVSPKYYGTKQQQSRTRPEWTRGRVKNELEKRGTLFTHLTGPKPLSHSGSHIKWPLFIHVSKKMNRLSHRLHYGWKCTNIKLLSVQALSFLPMIFQHSFKSFRTVVAYSTTQQREVIIPSRITLAI